MGNDTGLFCVQCGCANPLHAKFCRFCGHPVHPAPDHVPLSRQEAVLSARMAVVSQNVLTTDSHPVQAGRLLKQRYRIVKQVGAGGYGRVYRAIDTEFMDRQVAVKEMIRQGLDPAEVIEASKSFKREAVLLATLTHPNLPSIYDYFQRTEIAIL